MNHSPKNSHVKVAGVVHEVASARWCYGLVAYMLKGSGHMVYSWEQSVEPMESE
jgi:hypothetical protein